VISLLAVVVSVVTPGYVSISVVKEQKHTVVARFANKAAAAVVLRMPRTQSPDLERESGRQRRL
jgi:hypothetical protein